MLPTMFKNKKGFSYFELLAILVFLGIIATISFNYYTNFRADGELAGKQVEAETLQVIVSEYIVMYEELPTVLDNPDYLEKPALINLSLFAEELDGNLSGKFYIYGMNKKVYYDYPVSFVEKQYNKYIADKGTKPLIQNSNYVDMKKLYEQGYLQYQPQTSYFLLDDNKMGQVPPVQEIPLKAGDISNNGKDKPTTPIIIPSKDAPFFENEMITFTAESFYSKGKVTYEWENLSNTATYNRGTYVIGVTAIGEDGIKSDKGTFNLVVGNPNSPPSKPVITVSPNKGSYTSSELIDITATSIDPDGDSVYYKWIGKSLSKRYPIGTNIISVYAYDNYGNKSEIVKVSLKVVNSAPVITGIKHYISGIEVPNTQKLYANEVVTFKPIIEDYDNDLTEYQILSGLSSTNKYSYGSHILVFKAWDTLKQTTDYSHTFTISNSPPTAPTISMIPTNPDVTQPITYSASGSTDINNHSISYEYKLDNGAWSLTPPNRKLPSGNHTIYVKAKDSVGDYSAVSSKNFSVSSKQMNTTIYFPPDYNQTPTKSLDVGYSNFTVNNITVGITGTVSYTTIGTNINITPSNGSYISIEEYWNPYKYSTYATSYSTSSSSTFSSTKYYSDSGGYSGYIPQSGGIYVTSGSAGYQLRKYVSTTMSGSITSHFTCVSELWWDRTSSDYRPWQQYYSDWEGYSGYLDVNGGNPHPLEPPKSACYYDGYTTTRTNYSSYNNYNGYIYKDVPDTRTWRQNYAGTVYSGGTSYRNPKYEYTVNITYTIY